MTENLDSVARNLIARLAMQRLDDRMQELRRLREQSVRIRRMGALVAGLPTEWQEHAERLADYLYDPATANTAGFNAEAAGPSSPGFGYEESITSDYEF